MRREPKLIILECTSESRERMSEGMLLRELTRILGFGNKTTFYQIESRNDFLKKMERSQDVYLHISAHGNFHPSTGTRIDLPHKAHVYSGDLANLWKKSVKSRIPKLVVLSACETGHVDMVRAFSEAGCQYCIAPLHDTLWEDAAIFSTLLYKLLIGERMSPWVSFKKTSGSLLNILPRLSGAWSFYEWGERLVIDSK
jgi:hypothetical protein